MPTISEFFGIVIAMYFKEHNPPHFHMRYQGSKASINIRTGEVLDGKVPPQALRLVNEWPELYQNELLEDWDMAQRRVPPSPIPPLG